jgi:hypothetical protein
MKRNLFIVATLAAFGFSFSPVDAGPLRWIKETGEYLFDTQARREVREQAAARAAREAAEASSRQAARTAATQQLGRVSTAFQVGAYTFTGVMIFDMLAGYGYAMSETTHENEQVADEIATVTAAGEAFYQERFCTNPSSRERYVVPSWMVSCGDGSVPVNGQGIGLAGIRQQAAG